MNIRSLIIVAGYSLLLLLLSQGEKGVHGATDAIPSSPNNNDSTLFLPVVQNSYDPQFPAPLFGMQMYTDTGINTPYYPFLIGSQTSWVRSHVNWDEVEAENHTPAIYSWESTDRALAGARADMGGLHLIAVIDILPTWAQLVPGAVSGPIRPDALDDFAEFVQAAVERYDGDGYADAPDQIIVKHWELINEPDGGNPIRWGPYAAEYAQMLAVAYPAIKAADPAAQVLFGGIAYDWFDYQGGPFVSSFLDDVLTAGGGAYFDIMNFHMYPLFAPNWDSLSTGLKGKTAAIRAKLAEYGLDKPIVITEAGWHNSVDSDPPSNDAEQAARLIQLITQSYAADVKVMIWFMLHDPGDFLPNYGLVTSGDQPVAKGAYTAYQTAVSMLGNGRFVYDHSQVDSTSGLETTELYQFYTPNGPLYIGWENPYTTTETQTIQIAGTSAVLFNPWGNIIGTSVDDDNDGLVSITITNQPIYIQIITP